MEHHCTEHDKAVSVKLLRRGSGRGEIRVNWRTENVNTLPGSFKKRTGTVLFRDNIFEHVIEIGIIDDENWNVEAVEKVVLYEPVNCNLGDLWCTSIVVLNEDTFPNNVVYDKSAQFFEDGGHIQLLLGFISHVVYYFPSEFRDGLLLRVIAKAI